MKQFTVEEYQKNLNRKVITRDGKSVKIVCTDMIGTSYPVLAICRVDPTHDCYYSYTLNGKHNLGVDSRLDIFFVPEKHTAWTNIYKSEDGVYANGSLFESKEEALENSYSLKIATCKIEWEE